MPGPYHTIAQIKAANKASGHHWFSPATMRFFNSRVVGGVIAGRYFITREVNPSDDVRYSVRRAADDGTIHTVGKFHNYPTAQAARRFLSQYLKVSVTPGDAERQTLGGA